MIIGISGKIGSGKDTVGRIIQYLNYINKNQSALKVNFSTWMNNEQTYKLLSSKFSDWKIKKFGDKLKEIASILTGVDVSKFEDQEFKKLPMSPEWLIRRDDELEPDFLPTYRWFLQQNC